MEDALADGLKGDREAGVKPIAPRDHITTLKAIHDLQMQLLSAQEARMSRAQEDLATEDLARQVQALSARVEDLRSERDELKARVAQLLETQRAWASAGM
jgi:chromosome segregation ATPase